MVLRNMGVSIDPYVLNLTFRNWLLSKILFTLKKKLIMKRKTMKVFISVCQTSSC